MMSEYVFVFMACIWAASMPWKRSLIEYTAFVLLILTSSTAILLMGVEFSQITFQKTFLVFLSVGGISLIAFQLRLFPETLEGLLHVKQGPSVKKLVGLKKQQRYWLDVSYLIWLGLSLIYFFLYRI